MMKHIIFCSLFFININIVVYAEPATGFKKQATSSVSESFEETVRVRKLHNQRFDFSRFFNEDVNVGVTEILLEQTFERVEREDMEAIASSSVKVSAFTSVKDQYEHLLWSFEDEAEEGMLWDDYYKTVKYGCCAQETTYKLFDLQTGKLITIFTGELAKVDILDVENSSSARLIAYLSSAASIGFDENAKDAISTLTLNSKKGVEDKVILLSDNDEYSANTPKVHLLTEKQEETQLVLEAVTNGQNKLVPVYTVQLRFIDGQTLLIPVKQDKFDIDNIKGTAKIKVVREE
ncbi:hypothetical protein [Beggiatoa leptomitoformis]|uniref:Uncharacterized protein n=1 Tax=Beggiatoa leptomitoformis TaxID=288004 RepID=A0A2N9YC48_9GAMM|nr:hypothetical protein [Beggiatoa leptomitoformis]ALG66689.1 hypothetical protein AL038_01820 [Beggiatoa leptomitoformis]AUI67984.1 hypothetical protein BLE401_04220 [Beggiatoa leptomitoformis]